MEVDLLDHVDLGEYLKEKCFSVLPGKGHSFCINTKRIIKLTALAAFKPREFSLGSLRRLE